MTLMNKSTSEVRKRHHSFPYVETGIQLQFTPSYTETRIQQSCSPPFNHDPRVQFQCSTQYSESEFQLPPPPQFAEHRVPHPCSSTYPDSRIHPINQYAPSYSDSRFRLQFASPSCCETMIQMACTPSYSDARMQNQYVCTYTEPRIQLECSPTYSEARILNPYSSSYVDPRIQLPCSPSYGEPSVHIQCTPTYTESVSIQTNPFHY